MQLARMISNDNNKEEDPELMSKIRKVCILTTVNDLLVLMAIETTICKLPYRAAVV